MSTQDDKLQERIEQFENGESLESCLTGLSDQEAGALRLIASMQAMSLEDVEGGVIANQRAGILQAATKQLKEGNSAESTARVSLLMQLQTWISQLFSRQEVRYAFGAILILLFAGFFYKGVTMRHAVEDGNPPIVDAPGASENVEAAGDDANDVVTEEPAESVAAVPVEEIVEGESLFLPVVSSPLITSADTAVIQDINGLVEIQTEPDQWVMANNNVSLAAGQRIRTGALSKATLNFYDGSVATLNAHTELSIDELNALRP